MKKTLTIGVISIFSLLLIIMMFEINILNYNINNYKNKSDSLFVELLSIKDSTIKLDSINKKLIEDLFVAKYKLGRIEEYCNIVKKNQSQNKFLRGWINRVLEN